MTYKGYSVLALCCLAMLLVAVSLAAGAAYSESWTLMGVAGVSALSSIALAVLSVLDG